MVTSSITALVGDPVNIESTGEFDSMTITFKYTDDLNENYLRVMWFDEEKLDYVVLNDYTINRSSNTISINTTHFSKHMLIDESIWVNTWGDNMAMTKDTTALGSASTLSGYKSRMGRLNDEDSDGLPDIFETNGMLIQTGNVIYTDPNDPDSDKDGIMDGEEMGILNLSRIIFDRSPFNDYIDEWYAGYGYREWEYAYFKMESNPTMYSSDPDTIGDGIDATKYDINPEAVYIIFSSEWNNEAKFWKKLYSNEFTVFTYECSDWELFKRYWSAMGEVEGKIGYEIDRVILLYHGDIGAFWVGNSCIETEYIKVRFNDANGYISELQDKDIQILDLKICHSGDVSATNIDTGSYSPGTIEYERGYNIAIDFLINIPGIKCVRAWDGSYKFENNWLGHYERSFTSEGIINEFCYAYTWSNRVNSFWINTDYDIVRDGIYAYDTTLEFMKWISL